ncbi:MAG: hypothetical protein AB9Q23_14315 [Candidatus Reddybacter sp.]
MPILPPPPIAPVERNNAAIAPGLIVVYLPFATPAKIEQLLQPSKHQYFAVYHADLSHCNGVVCNACLELSSEVLQLGCKLLVRPVHG